MDALLLTIYFLVVFYVLYQMALSLENKLEDKVIIKLDTDFLAEQTQMQLSSHRSDAKHIQASTEEIGMKDTKFKYNALSLAIKQDLRIEQIDSAVVETMRSLGMTEEEMLSLAQKKITIRVVPLNKQTLRPISYLSITATNDTPDMQLYINWDHSSLEMYKQGHRIIRSTSNNRPRDLSQPQIFSVVNPGQSVMSDVTIEKNYAYDSETNQMKLARPLVDLAERLELSQMTDPTKEEKNIQPLYNLDLMIGIKRVVEHDSKLINLLVPFSFSLEIEPDRPAFPPMRWLLRNFGRRNRPEGSWFWGQ